MFKKKNFAFVSILFIFEIINKNIYLVLSIDYNYYDENYGKTWMYFPDGDGIPQVANLTMPSGRAELNFLSAESSVYFELYTRRYSREPKTMHIRKKRDKTDWLQNFLKNTTTKIIIHGWMSSTKSDTVQEIKNEYLIKMDCNVIAVDWKSLASNVFYPLSVSNTRDVGRYTAQFIDFLHEKTMTQMKQIHIIGHSLGAHVAGFAGSYTKYGQISRITGLDPAKPFFDGYAEEQLDPTDAEFVDIIHTCGGALGLLTPIGHIDFYPNGGKPMQPGCNGLLAFIDSCSHGRSAQFFAESINSLIGFYGTKCDSWNNYKDEKCTDNTTNLVLMGDNVSRNARGEYYLFTTNEKPYALGRN